MACGDVLSLEDLQTAKKHQIFEAEVITGKAGGVAGGATIGTATNPVTGQTQQTLPSILAYLGFDVQSWTSSTGGVLASANQVFLNDTPGSLGLGDYYAWGGTFPKTVPAGTDPALPTSGYVMRSSRLAGVQAREALRRSYAEAGYNLVDGSFEAGGTLVNVNDVLLQERTGKAFSGPAGAVAAGTDPASGGFVDISNVYLYEFNAATYGLKEGNTGLENCKALQALSAAVIAAGGGKIVFPSGTFEVGAQTFAGATGKGYSYKAEPMLELFNLDKVHLHFSNTNLVMSSGLRAGSFNPVTGAIHIPPAGGFVNLDYRAEGGRPIRIESCKQVVISGSLEIDGNDGTRIIGGYWGDVGHQVWDTGLYIIRYERLSSGAVIYSHDWVADSLYIAGLWGDNYSTYIKSFTAIRSGRNTLSLCGGSNMVFENCLFGYQGQSGSAVKSSPASAMDLETEIDKCENVEFISCEFLDSANGVVGTSFARAKGVKFTRCKFISRIAGGASLYWGIAGTDFNDCEIHGHVVAVTGGTSSFQRLENVRMNRCKFSNIAPDGTVTPGRENRYALIDSAAQVVNSGVTIRTEFNDCDFAARLDGTNNAASKAIFISGSIVNNCRMTIEGQLSSAQQVINLYSATVDKFTITNNLDYIGSNTDLRPYIGTNGAYIQRLYLSKKLSSVDNILTMLLVTPYISGGGNYGWLALTGSGYDYSESVPCEIALGLRKNATYSPEISRRYGGPQILQSWHQLPTSGNFQKGDILFHWDAVPGEPMGWQCTTTGVAGSTAVFKPLANVGV